MTVETTSTFFDSSTQTGKLRNRKFLGWIGDKQFLRPIRQIANQLVDEMQSVLVEKDSFFDVASDKLLNKQGRESDFLFLV